MSVGIINGVFNSIKTCKLICDKAVGSVTMYGKLST